MAGVSAPGRRGRGSGSSTSTSDQPAPGGRALAGPAGRPGLGPDPGRGDRRGLVRPGRRRAPGALRARPGGDARGPGGDDPAVPAGADPDRHARVAHPGRDDWCRCSWTDRSDPAVADRGGARVFHRSDGLRQVDPGVAVRLHPVRQRPPRTDVHQPGPGRGVDDLLPAGSGHPRDRGHARSSTSGSTWWAS